MKNGDLAIATSASVVVSKEDRTPDEVIGRLEITPVKFLNQRFNSCLVFVKDGDGDDVPVEVEEDSIRPAGRRAKVTVLS